VTDVTPAAGSQASGRPLEAGIDVASGEGVSVVVMAFNEREGLAPVVGDIRETLLGLGRDWEIVIVDDGSSDGTGAVADGLAAEIPGVRVVHHEGNRGLGDVYRTGFKEARKDLLTFFPADGQFPSANIATFVPLMTDRDLVLGYLPVHGRGPLAAALSKTERALYRILFGPLPRFQGILMVRRALLGRLELESSGRGWAVIMELILRAQRAGCRIHSEPTSVRPRRAGLSKVQDLRTIWSNLRQVAALRRRL
jgi:glycosyltransferase involved in cell wall biosynthesis